jgi:MFS family permease
MKPANAISLISVMGLAQILAWSSTYYLPAVLVTPISSDTEWSITSVVIGLSVALLVAGVASPKVGRTIDKHGGRATLASSSVLMSLGLLIMGSAQHLAIYYLAWCIIGVGMATGLYDAAFATLGRLLGERAKSSISGLTLLGGFASTIGWPLLTILENELGWRGACFVLAGIHLMIGLPIYLIFIPKVAANPAANSVVMPSERPNLPVGHHHLFLLVSLLLTLLSLVTSSISVHLLDTLKLLGIATATALAIGMVIGPAQVIGRIGEFTLGKNSHPTLSTRLGIILCLSGIALLLTAQPLLAFIAIALYGAGNGILTITRGTLPLVLFGSDGYGARMGLLARPMLIAQSIGPIAAAICLDVYGANTLLLLLIGLVFAALITSIRLPLRRS